MASLISPGVSVTITDESFFIPAAAVTVPLLFIATAAEKKQPDGVTDAPGTFESNVIRTVTSLTQSTQLYGIPTFLKDDQGLPLNGDARNEYGLFALNQFLGIGDLAFVIRANVNLNDNLNDLRDLWNQKQQEASFVLENITAQYINEYNTVNGFTPSSGATAGYQYASFAASTILLATATGVGAGPFTFSCTVDGVLVENSVSAVQAATFGSLLTRINAILAGVGVASYYNNATPAPVGPANRLQIISASTGLSSTVVISTTSSTFGANIFPALAGPPAFVSLGPQVRGTTLFKYTVTSAELLSLTHQATAFIWEMFSFSRGVPPLEDDFFDDHTASPLPVYPNGYDLPPVPPGYLGFEGIEAAWVAGNLGSTPGLQDQWTPTEASNTLLGAADDFQYTTNFLNKTSLGANDAARRVAIVTALQASINSNQDIRGETFEYNLILCPGYSETVDEMYNLVIDIQEEAMVIGDTPSNLDPDQVVAWAATTGRTQTRDVAYYYPWSLASNLNGENCVVAASGTALRTITNSDEISEIWFAPAGTRRGIVSGVTDIGYVVGTLGTPTLFVPVALNQGQRNNLYKYFTNLNPIVFFPGRGILVWGQKTSAPDASALDRINVMRLVMYIKRSLRKNTMSFVFEPNDQLTRDNLKAVVDAFLGDLIVKRGLYDFATVCDETNNTPDRIDRNEMYIDVALKPVRAAEFIYIPMRIVATGAQI
jgi:hypothetical protein